MSLSKISYDTLARKLPAVIAFLPFLFIYYFVLDEEIKKFFNFIALIDWGIQISAFLILIYIIGELGRKIAVDIENKIYKNQFEMPTTLLLMFSKTTYTRDFCNKLHAKIYKDFDIKLFDLKKELLNTSEAQNKIIEAVSLIRGKVKDGYLVLNHNIQYGFIRNTIGCLYLGFPITIISSILLLGFTNDNVFYLSIIFMLIYSLPLIFKEQLIMWFGNRYAKVLLQEYLGLTA